MKKSRFTEEQIAFALKQAETGRRWRRCCAGSASPSGPFIAGRSSTAGWIPIRMRVQVLGFDSIRRMVEASLGIAILPRRAVLPYLGNKVWQRLN